MDCRVNKEIPHTQFSLVSIGKNHIRVDNLVCYELVELASFKLHLLFEVLVLNDVGTSIFIFESITDIIILDIVVRLLWHVCKLSSPVSLHIIDVLALHH
jgi:hypothetical protein